MGAQEKNIKFHKMTSYTRNFQNFTWVFAVLVKFDIYFLGLQITQITHYKISIALEKSKKESDIVSIFLVHGFCPLKIEITH